MTVKAKGVNIVVKELLYLQGLPALGLQRDYNKALLLEEMGGTSSLEVGTQLALWRNTLKLQCISPLYKHLQAIPTI